MARPSNEGVRGNRSKQDQFLYYEGPSGCLVEMGIHLNENEIFSKEVA